MAQKGPVQPEADAQQARVRRPGSGVVGLDYRPQRGPPKRPPVLWFSYANVRKRSPIGRVMAGVVPAIHVFDAIRVFKAWMPGTRPGMTSQVSHHAAFVLLDPAALSNC